MMRRFSFGASGGDYTGGFSPRVRKPFFTDDTSIPDTFQAEQEDPYDSVIKRYKSVLEEETPALTKYRQRMSEIPLREDYQLGRWGKLGAALAGFGTGIQNPAMGVEVGRSLNEGPFRQALENYEMELGNLGNQAEFEQNDRQNRMKGLDLELDSLKSRAQQRREDMLASSLIGRRNTQNRKDIFDIENPEMDTEYGPGGELLFVDPRRQTVKNTGQLTSKTTDLNNTKFGNQTGRMNAITGQGNLRMRGNEFELAGDKFRWDKMMDSLNFGQRVVEEGGRNSRDNASTSWLTPAAQESARDLTIRELYQQYPQFRQYMNTPSSVNDIIDLRNDLTQEELDSPDYQEFEGLLRGLINEKLNRSRNGGTSRYRREQ